MAYDPNEPRDDKGEWTTGGASAGGKARLSIRASKYRDKPGFSISGTSVSGGRVRVFTETRSSAEHIKAKLQRGEHIDVPDFAPRPYEDYSRPPTRASKAARAARAAKAFHDAMYPPAHDAKPINGAVGKPRRSR